MALVTKCHDANWRVVTVDNSLLHTGPPGYSDTAYSETLATVTVLAIPKPYTHVNENPLLMVTILDTVTLLPGPKSVTVSGRPCIRNQSDLVHALRSALRRHMNRSKEPLHVHGCNFLVHESCVLMRSPRRRILLERQLQLETKVT